MQTLLIVLLPLSALLGAVTLRLSPIAFTRVERSLSAKGDQGNTHLAAREMLVDVMYPGGRTGKGALMILFHPPTGYFVWGARRVMNTVQRPRMTAGHGTSTVAYVTSERLILFNFGHPNLVIHQSVEKARSLDDAERMAFAQANSRSGIDDLRNTELKTLSLWKVLPREFFAPPLSATYGPVRILDVSRRDRDWEVILQGQWKEKVTLNDRYEITGTARLQ